MTVSEAKDMDILFARLDDLCGAAMQGDLAATSFLSPRELYFSDKYLKSRGMSSRFISWGGYDGAERAKIFVLPDYIEDNSDFSAILGYGFVPLCHHTEWEPLTLKPTDSRHRIYNCIL